MIGGEPADIPFSVKLTRSERDALGKLAEAEGCTLSFVVRREILNAIGRGPHLAAKELEELRLYRNELNAIGRNLNQCAKALNLAAHTGEWTVAMAGVVERLGEVVEGVVKARKAVSALVARGMGVH